MRFADRLDRIPPFFFTELRLKAERKRATGVDVIALGTADPDVPTPDAVVEAMRRAVADPVHHRYPHTRGMAAFREAARAFMGERFGVDLDPDTEIVPALGGKDAVHHMALTCLGPGDVCLSPEPGYPVYTSAPVIAGAEVAYLPLVAANGFLPDFDAIPKDVLGRANLLYLNYPNNPTGAVADLGFFERAAAFARRHDIIVVHDSSYSEIAFDGHRPPSFLAAPGAREVGVEVFSLSKGWNMTGWRAGWVAGNAEIMARYAHLKPNIDTGMFGALQTACVAALTEAVDFPRQMSALYRKRRDLMIEALRAAGLDAVPPKATPFLWVPVPEGFTSSGLSDLILERTGVVMPPGIAFGASGEGFVRISLTVPDDRLAEAARRIAETLDLAAPAGGAVA